MTEYTLAQASLSNASIEIHYTGCSPQKMNNWLGNQYKYIEQVSGDLGEKMSAAFKKGFDCGFQRIVLLGCDTPNNRLSNILLCFSKLCSNELVLGPAVDGGYYMIGLSRYLPSVFVDIQWGSSQVLEQTLHKVNSYGLVTKMSDIDYASDLPPKISVIIPIYNEENHIVETICSAYKGFNIEVIVVDGGSSDNSYKVANSNGAIVYKTTLSRAKQMNYGAERASGDILLFLHGDSQLPEGWDIKVRELLGSEKTMLGYFTLSVRDRLPGIQIIEWLVKIRCRLFSTPYGDQALFIHKKTFMDLGMYKDQPILEDLELVKKVRHTGQVLGLSQKVLISGRRWNKLGILKTTLYNQSVLLAARLGVDLKKLCKAYRCGNNPFWEIFK